MVDLTKALPKYLEILKGKRKPSFKGTSLDEKIEHAFEMLEDCKLCERKCGVNRQDNEVGFCKVGNKMSVPVGGRYVGYNDLEVISPSYDVFFLGCILGCVFCQNPETAQVDELREAISEKRLAKIIDSRSSCKIVDFVGGDPLPQLPFILKILSHVERDIPIMWNSSFYMTEESMGLLEGVVDIYSPDFKYGNDKCAKRLSKVDNYTEIVKRNHILARKDSDMITRHLVLPNHFECCTKPVLDFVANEFGDGVIVHLMDQYTPCWKVKEYPERYSDINRKLRKHEFKEVVSYAEKRNLNYISEM